MAKNDEYGTKLRLLRILLALVDNPKAYTLRQLAHQYSVSDSTIKKDFETFKNAGLQLKYDGNYRYYFVENRPYKKLQDLLHFSEEDQALLYRAINEVAPHSKRAEKLKKKLNALYDFRKLGHAYLRKPYLDMVDNLTLAKEKQQRVILKDYRSSNGNKIGDRLVEAFYIDPAEDMIQVIDTNNPERPKHFRISRTRKVELTEQPCTHQQRYSILHTDPFRIVHPKPVMVHLRFKLGPRNELCERFPLAERFIIDAEEDGYYDFQCRVNPKFMGLTNFILGYYHQGIEVLEPESLLDHLNETVRQMKF